MVGILEAASLLTQEGRPRSQASTTVMHVLAC